MSDKPATKKKPKLKKLACGGYGIFAEDPKSKTEGQIGYIGPNLSLDGFCPPSDYDR
jgi:hypothetical protein